MDFAKLVEMITNLLGTAAKEYGLEAALYGPEGVAMKVVSQGLAELETKLKVLDADIKIGAEDFTPYGAIGYWNDVYEKISNVNQNLGVAGILGKSLKHEFKDAFVELADIGVEADELSKNIKAFSEDYGRVTLISSKEMVEMSSMAKVFGQESIEILSTYRYLGISIEESTTRMKQLTLQSNKFGVIPSRAVKVIKDSLSAVDKYHFKGGTKAFESMAIQAARLNSDMKSGFSMIDKILDGGIEGAVEMAQEFQLMGGPIAQMGNVFDLVQKALSGDVEGFEKGMASAVAKMATIGKDGEITFDTAGMMQIRQLADKTGASIESITKMGRAMAKEMDIGKQMDLSLKAIPGDFDAMLAKVAGAASKRDVFGNWLVTIDGVEKKVQDLTKDDIEAKLSISPEGDEKDTFKDIVKANMDLGEIINKLIAQLKVTALSGAGEAYQNLIGTAQKTADNMVATLKPFAESFSKLSEGAYNNFKPILEGLSEGDLLGAFTGVATNLGKVAAILGLILSPTNPISIMIASTIIEPIIMPYFMEAITVLKNLAWNASQYIMAGVMYLVDYAILEIKKIFTPIQIGPGWQMPTFEDYMKNKGYETVDLLKDTALLKGYTEVPGLSYTESQDLRSKLSEDVNKGVNVKDLGTVFEHSVTGEITVKLPDGSTRPVTAEEIPLFYDAAKKVLNGEVNTTTSSK